MESPLKPEIKFIRYYVSLTTKAELVRAAEYSKITINNGTIYCYERHNGILKLKQEIKPLSYKIVYK
jgi:hypothetical protein